MNHNYRANESWMNVVQTNHDGSVWENMVDNRWQLQKDEK
jgi:hypothetical protein